MVGSSLLMVRASACIHPLEIGILRAGPTTGLRETRFAGQIVGPMKESVELANWKIRLTVAILQTCLLKKESGASMSRRASGKRSKAKQAELEKILRSRQIN